MIAEKWEVIGDWHEFVLGTLQMNFHMSDTEQENQKSLLNEKIKTMVHTQWKTKLKKTSNFRWNILSASLMI